MSVRHRALHLFLAVAVLALGIAACAPTPTPVPTAAPPTAAPTVVPPTATPAPVTFVDDSQAEIVLPAPPQRIVSLVPSITEILYALGAGDNVVGNTTYCDYPEAAKGVEKVGSFTEIDLEKVVGLAPDIVFGGSLHSQQTAPALRERGVQVALLEANSIEGTLDQISRIGQLIGREAEADALVKQLQGRLDAVSAKVSKAPRPRVFWELDPTLYTAGKGSFVDDLITYAGGENIGRQMEGEWPQFSLETLIAADPEVIVLADHGFGETADTVKARPGWEGITAVKNGRIVEVEDINIVSRAGPRLVDAVEYIAKALHPDLFQ
ncbi:MAG: ABC transporter substrate-binding protein [Anaerolineae bacterium]